MKTFYIGLHFFNQKLIALDWNRVFHLIDSLPDLPDLFKVTFIRKYWEGLYHEIIFNPRIQTLVPNPLHIERRKEKDGGFTFTTIYTELHPIQEFIIHPTRVMSGGEYGAYRLNL